jgi:putative GTP pyrophosphokinase
MTYLIPRYTKGAINRAGIAIVDPNVDFIKVDVALELINHWRACHAYPVNTFQATLRSRLKKVCPNALVAQRLKRIPSITKKLSSNSGMQLSRMQDIGGLRAVVDTISQVEKLRSIYGNGNLTHKLIGSDDYIASPKPSGYRSLHLIYRYQNPANPQFEGLNIELQIRTKLQHAWATAVETIGSFLNQSLKSSEGPDEWLYFFRAVSAGFAVLEKCQVPEEFADQDSKKLMKLCVELGNRLDVKAKLGAFVVATNSIAEHANKRSYHLVVLDAKARTVSIQSFSKKKLESANAAYAQVEMESVYKSEVQAVLVSTDSITSLRKAFPNYFLDTRQFLSSLNRLEVLANA